MGATRPEKSPLAEALAKLDEAMRPPRGSSSDPDRRRLSVRLSDLARCEDDDLSAFAKRHLPGRAVDEPALRAAREMILAIGRVLGPEGESPEALGVLKDAHRALDERLAEAKRAAAQREAETQAEAARVAASVAAPAPVPVAVAVAVPVPALVSAPALVVAPVAAPALVAAPPPPPEQPAWLADTDPTGLLSPEIGIPAQPVLPFSQATDEERPPPSVTRIDVAAPPQPVASFVDEPTQEPLPTAAPQSQAAPVSYHESPPPSVVSSALPFAAPNPQSAAEPMSMRSPPSLTLNQYAGLVVACELYPAYIESTHARYGVPTAAARAALDAFWAGRIAADPELAERWRELYAAARRYFLQSR